METASRSWREGNFFSGHRVWSQPRPKNPFAGLVIFQAIANALLKFSNGFDAGEIYLQLCVGRAEKMDMRVVETRHDELFMEIDHTRVWAD